MSLQGRKSLEPYLFDSVEYYPHQIEGVRWLAKRRNFILADDMGLGKSLQAITTATVDVARDMCSKIIVVCPSTLKGNWADEIEKFTRYEYMIWGKEKGPRGRTKTLGPVERIRQLREFSQIDKPKILIANYEQIKPHLQELNVMGFDIAIFDEAHYMKNAKSQRTKACLSLNTTRSFMLTGTPMLNMVNELWPLLHKCDPVKFKKYWLFVNRYCVFGGWENKQIIGVKNESELTAVLGNYMLRRLKKDVLDLPEVQIIQRKVDLTPQQQDIYDTIIEELRLEFFDADSPELIENALTKFLRLKQVCGTTFQFTGEDHSAKLDLSVEDAIEILDNNHKLVVFTQFRSVQERFCYRLDKLRPDIDIWELNGSVKNENRIPIVHEWEKSPKPGVLVCMLQVAGLGLNMTAAQHAFFLDKLFTPGMNQQAIDRLHRIGQSSSQPVQITEYICRDTVEDRVESILRTKKKLFGMIVDDPIAFKKKLIASLMEDE